MDGILKHLPKGGDTFERKKLTRSKEFQEVMEIFDIRDQGIRDQCLNLVKKKNEITLEALKKAGANIDDIPQLAKDCENHILPDKREVIHYKGKAVIEFHPPQFNPIRREGLSFFQDMGFSYRILI